LLFHGAPGSRLLKHIRAGGELCVAFTLLDGLVLARAVCHHSMNYRSAVLFGRGQLIDGEEEKLRALQALTDQILPGRWGDARPPTRTELRTTAVVAMPIDSASAKIRSGQPVDDEDDLSLPIWAGVLPLRQQVLEPIPDPRLSAGIPLPDYVDEGTR
jgi:nitroimidazol reductase NimA-like FMN-containing flavoprotein (pyridoxamine 5'-phosphate oxidase superfamily)